jgi:hypothetical protein
MGSLMARVVVEVGAGATSGRVQGRQSECLKDFFFLICALCEFSVIELEKK